LYLVYSQWMNLPIINAVPIFLAVTMLGVGVDYDIFLLTRVREEVVKGKSDEDAIKVSLEKIGTTIMFLGLLLSSTFLLLLIPRFPLLNEIGFAIGLSVLFDSFIIVQFFVPSIMLLAKKWNWWPSKLSRGN
ncbi:MAG TPA: MMPL family transporter, partial [Geobacterales bacterium]|nr:MMPL family transporter [Geobacterales bacterium]